MIQTISWVIACLFLAACLHITFFSWVQLQLLYFSRRIPRHPKFFVNTTSLPLVTIQLPVYNEKYVVKKLIEKICAMEYPAGRLEIQILDDSTDETSEIITDTITRYQQQGICITHIRRKNRQGYKAGALQHGLQTAKGELIAIFDADFRPKADFLLKTVPYFHDKKVGALQTRWGYLNEDFSLLTKLQAVLLNNHFIIEQSGRDAGGLTLQFNGTAGLWRKQTILDAGGWQSDTLLEDVDLSYRAQLKGWKIVFLKDLVCPAEIPPDLKALKVQQFRWMQGQAEVARKHLAAIWKSDFSLFKKFHATMHLTSCYVFVSILLTALLSVPMIYIIQDLGIDSTWLALVSAGFLLSGIVFFYANYFIGWQHFPKSKRVLRFMLLFPLLLLYSMGLAFHNTVAVCKGLLGIKTPFYRTPKYDMTHSPLPKALPKYKTHPVSFMAAAEFCLILYFSVGIGIGLYTRHYTFLSYNIVLAIAYTVVLVQSVEIEPNPKRRQTKPAKKANF